ncbi:MAG: hypothetical protein ACFFBS_04770 [Promethearchaeota archaeon]
MVEKELFQAGISQIFLMVSAFLLFFSWMWELLLLFGIAAQIVFLISAILYLISIREISRRFSGSPIGRIGAIFGLITGTIALVLYIVAQIIYPIVGYNIWRYYLYLFLIMPAVTIGGTATLIGIFFLAYRRYFVYEPFWITTGIIYMIAGITYLITYSAWACLIISLDWYKIALWIVSLVAIVVGSIEGTVCFFVSRPKG